MKIVRPAQGSAGVYFPRGTCEFATETCRKECYMIKDKDYDEEVRISDGELLKIYDTFTTMPMLELCAQILTEMDGLQTNILHWFASGDCKKKDMSRILKIIEVLDRADIEQIGFTRNERLWEERKDVFALTVEKKSEIDSREGLFAIPDYKNGSIALFVYDDEQIGTCGMHEYQHTLEPIEHIVNCNSCFRLKVGCFTEDR